LEDLKKYSKKSFWIITIFILFLTACVNIGIYQVINWLKIYFHGDAGNDVLIKNISNFMEYLQLISNHFYAWVVPSVLCLFLLIGYIIWMILRSSTAKIFLESQVGSQGNKLKNKSKKDFVDQRIEQERKRRLFLHSLSVLQRDGRLLDFFDEDLSLYDDEQIGAAVRSVQEDCKKTIKKYINLKPVMDSEEGEKVRVEPEFDIDSIKLIGRVSGDPPFEGILKHRGWKAGKKEIPKLSDIQDSTIISPAEIEIQ
jgi:hypothetical protein